MPAFVYPHLNTIAILVAAAVQFVLGFLWYSNMTPIGKAWIAAMDMRDEPGRPGAEMAVFPIGSIVAAGAVAMVIGWSGASGTMNGVMAAWVVALSVAAQVVASSVATAKASPALLAINVGYVTVGYGLMGAIIGAMS